jgi:glutamate racemase
MKIGVFDSGIGGLFTLKAITKLLPAYDYVYLGDTKRVPYGSRSEDTIYTFLKEGVDFLFSQDCALVVVACNTASTTALRRIQQEYIPVAWPDRNALGMIVPLAEACEPHKSIGVIATIATVASLAYPAEITKRFLHTSVRQVAAPLLVPLIEQGERQWVEPILADYLKKFGTKKLDALVLGCTHYPIVKSLFKKLLPKGTVIISQDSVVPKKLQTYLSKHGEIYERLSKNSTRRFCVTDITPAVAELTSKWFGKDTVLERVDIEA